MQAERKWTTESVVSQTAVRNKQLQTVTWLSDHDILKERDASNWRTLSLTAQAAANNHFEMLEYLHSKGFVIDYTTCEAAVKHPNGLEMIIWLHQLNLLGNAAALDSLLTKAGSEVVRDWLLEVIRA
jgi:hypothetical protein